MIARVTRGSDVSQLLGYLYGPGRAGEHVDPHLVASWRGDTRDVLDPLEPDPALTRGRASGPVVERLTLPLELADPVRRPVWHCSLRVAPADRRLTDPEWATVARDVIGHVGFASTKDRGGCRWVAVRHAVHHVHLAVVLARQDGDPVSVAWDWQKVGAATRAIERRLGLVDTGVRDRSARTTVTRGEQDKAARRGDREPARWWLAREVRTAAAGSRSRQEFAAALARAGVRTHWRAAEDDPGRLVGFAAGRPGDLDARGVQIFYSGSRLAPDLSLPRLQARWTEVLQVPGSAAGRRSTLERVAAALTRATGEPLTPAVAISGAEVASVLARAVEGPGGGPLTQAADRLAEAARRPYGVRPDLRHHLHPLRDAATSLNGLGRLLPDEHAHTLEIVGRLAHVADALGAGDNARSRLHARHCADHLIRYTGSPTASDAARVTAVLGPERGTAVTADPAWPALAAGLRSAAQHGLDPAQLLRLATRATQNAADARPEPAHLTAALHRHVTRLATGGPGLRPTVPGAVGTIRGRTTVTGRRVAR